MDFGTRTYYSWREGPKEEMAQMRDYGYQGRECTVHVRWLFNMSAEIERTFIRDGNRSRWVR